MKALRLPLQTPLQTLSLLAALASFNATAWAGEHLLICGSGSPKIVILDKDSNEVLWSHDTPAGSECNSIDYTDEGLIAYSYKQGAKVMTKEGKIIFDYTKVDAGEELQSIEQTATGYLVAICGHPARLVELDKMGKELKTIPFDTKIDVVHNQFRQVRKSPQGTYLIPLFGGGKVVEINDKGEVLASITLDDEPDFYFSPFTVCVTRAGKWLVPCGHAGVVYEIDPKTKAVREFVNNEMLKGQCRIEFGCEVLELDNGHFYHVNWLGHNGDQSQSSLMELSPEGKFLWKMEGKVEGLPHMSAVRVIPQDK